MRGSIRKHGKGYQIRLDWGIDPVTKKRRQKTKSGFLTKADAEKELAKLLVQAQNKNFNNIDSTISMENYLNRWLDYSKNNIEESTYVFYRKIILNTLIPYFGEIRLDKLNSMHIQDFLTSKYDEGKVSKTTIRHYYTVLNIALNQAIKWNMIDVNPTRSIDPPKKDKKKFNVLELHEIEKLMNYTKTSKFSLLYLAFHLAIFAGLRRGEIIGLQWEDINFENKFISVRNNRIRVARGYKMSTPKTDKSVRTVALLDSTINLLKEAKVEQNKNKLLFGQEYYKEENYDFVCCWPNGKPLDGEYVSDTFKKIIRKLEFDDIRFHDLRHTHATLLLSQGVNPKIVSERLGHSSIGITLDTYSHVLPNMQQEAINKLENIL